MPHRFPTTWVALSLVFVLLAVSACGGKAAKPKGGSSSKFRPQAGHVTTHPTAAQAFMYLPRSTVQETNGDILVADGGNWDRSGGKIVELNKQGTPDWVYYGGLDFPHAAYPMSNGDVLISDTGNDRVIEVTRQGKIVWNSDNLGGGKGFLGQGVLSNGAKLLYPNDAVMLPKDRILITSRYSNAVYEIEKSGKVVWSCSRFMLRQHNARLLADGNLMVADSDHARVLIINHACNHILFTYGTVDVFGSATIVWPRSFQPYSGGNFIVGDSLHDRILEISAKKKILQEWRNLPSPFYVTVLPNHDLLTGDSNIGGAVELGPNGTIVRQYTTVNPQHYPAKVVNPGFENVTPKGWLQGDMLTETLPAGVRANMAFDSSVHHSGKSSGRITWSSRSGHLFLAWFQNVSVTPGATYHFAGWMKTKNIQACTGCDYGAGSSGAQSIAQFQANFVNPHSPLNPSTPAILLGNPETGTTGWTRQSATFTVPAGVTVMQIQCQLLGRGTVWFDDVSIN